MCRRILLVLLIIVASVVGWFVVVPSTPVEAATTADILVLATPNFGGGGGAPLPPMNFTAVEADSVLLTWTNAPSTNNTMIRVKYGEYPVDRNDGYLVYYGSGESATDTNVDFELFFGEVFYRAWSENATGDWSTDAAEDWVFGGAMTILALGLIALGLTVAMFMSRQAMLGFPCLLFWAILGGYAYTQSTTAWADWQYFLFFGSFGMAIFCAFAAYGLRTKKEELAEGDEFIDEGKDDVKFIDEGGKNDTEIDEDKPRRVSRSIRERAERRRQRWD